MTAGIFLIVIAAALLNATWNALAKRGADKHLSMAAMVTCHLPIALALLLFVDMPLPASWLFVIAGAVLHTGYQLFLLSAYRNGEFTQVYPIARGSAPILIAIVSVLLFHEALSSLQILGIVVVSCGIISISTSRTSVPVKELTSVFLALGTGGFIAAYSLVDGAGARLAGTALGYYCWLSIINVVLFTAIISVVKPGTLGQMHHRGKFDFVVGGAISFLAYALIAYAFTQAPVAIVSALREVSIIFALLIGVFVLKERVNMRKLVFIMVTLLGVTILKFTK